MSKLHLFLSRGNKVELKFECVEDFDDFWKLWGILKKMDFEYEIRNQYWQVVTICEKESRYMSVENEIYHLPRKD